VHTHLTKIQKRGILFIVKLTINRSEDSCFCINWLILAKMDD